MPKYKPNDAGTEGLDRIQRLEKHVADSPTLTPSSSLDNVTQASSAGVVPSVIKAVSGQTADLLQFQDSSGAVLSSVTATGTFSGGAMTSVKKFGVVASDRLSPVDVSAAINAAIAALQPGQALFFPDDPARVSTDSKGDTVCAYCIASPICLTQEIPIIFESRRVRLMLTGSAWGSTYFHAVRNWALSETGYTEVLEQAPDTTASYVSFISLLALDGLGVHVDLNGNSNVSAFSFVHPHEESIIDVWGRTGASGTSLPIQYGNRVISLFCNNDTKGGNIAGPIRIQMNSAGQGWDHMLYADGHNGGTTATGVNALNSSTVNVGNTQNFAASGTAYLTGVAFTYTGKTSTSFTGSGSPAATTGGELVYTCANPGQDIVLDGLSVNRLSNGISNCIKAPIRLKTIDGFRLGKSGFHMECLPMTAPPTAGAGLWQAGTAVAQGTHIIVQSSDAGANQGLAAMAICTVAGTTGGSAPTWPSPTSAGQTVTDNTVTWQMASQTSSSASNGTNGILDGCTPWPGAGLAVPRGTTISVDGTNGWVCTTAGTTSGSQPAFSTAGGRGATQTDGTVVWTYITDNFDNAAFRFTDVGHVSLHGITMSADFYGTNQPISKLDTTGIVYTQQEEFVYQLVPSISGMTINVTGRTVSGLAAVDKGGFWGSLFVKDATKIPWSMSFDPHRIDSADGYTITYLNGNTFAPAVYYLGTRSKSHAEIVAAAHGLICEPFSRMLCGSATAPVSGTAYGIETGLRAGDVVTGVQLYTNVALAVGGASGLLFKVGLWDSAGNLLASSADLSGNAQLTTSGRILHAAFASSYTALADGQYFVGFIYYQGTGGAPTAPQFMRSQSSVTGAAGAGTTGVATAFTAAGLTDIGSVTATATSTITYWCAPEGTAA